LILNQKGKITSMSAYTESAALTDAVFMKACRGEAVPYTPVWLMRQAGRYMQEYREVREKVPFIELCKDSDLAAEVAITAADKLGVDAAILFSDILLILEPLGMHLEYVKGDGPKLHNPIRQASDVDRIADNITMDSMSYVFDAVSKTRAGLPANIPLIGFSGAPFTLASYLIEGGSSRHFENTKTLMYNEPTAWHELMEKLVRALILYMNDQVEAGAQVLQVFDSWVGCLNEADYRNFVLPHTQALIQGITSEVPVIHFGTGTSTILEAMRDAGGDIIGIDYRMDLMSTWERLGDVKVQGNLDPVILMSNRETVVSKTRTLLEQVNGKPGHIFNLGHGVLPSTPVDNAIALVDCVHEITSKS
jgi:uroporphyrinogen decarboxylase